MGRVLTASFEYKGNTYIAVVAIRANADGLDLNITLPDETLHHLLPGGKFAYNMVHGTEITPALPGNEPAQELVACIIRTIETHLGSP
jgi:hypothetical protein